MPTSGADIVNGLAAAVGASRRPPLWARLVAWGLGLVLPGPWKWIATAFPILVEIIENLPKNEREPAKAELSAASKQARDGDPVPLSRLVSGHLKRKCEGIACPSDTVGNG